MDPTDDSDDMRRTELETLEAIFPELRKPQGADSRFVFELEIPVDLAEPLTVTFPPAGNAVEEDQASQNGQPGPAAPAVPQPLDSLQVSHLPPISILISLPDGYPESCPPRVSLKTTPQWLSNKTLSRLEKDAPRLWEEMGRDMVAYTYIDHIQRGADDIFGTTGTDGTLVVDPEHKLAVLDYDIKAKKAAFERETFECGVCLDPKKGTSCHKMMDCGHIFCLQCLRDFYGDAIKSGEILTVRCLTPKCAKERASKTSADTAGRPAKKAKTFVSPSELLQIGLSEELVKRYVTLKYKTELESDKNTIYCPRQWCNGAARSKKHKKPQGLELVDVSDEDDDDQDTEVEDGRKRKEKTAAKARFNPADLLCVCDDCGFAFCSRCFQSWHGEFVRCAGKKTTQELTEEEKASAAYLELHTSPCPTCSAPAQKTHGCNHMVCSRCDTHFCYLCSAWLDPSNPYKHYNMQANGKVTSCYMRLWELEGGDGNDVGLGFGGGQGQAPEAVAVPAPIEEEILVLPPEEEESDGEESVLDEIPANGVLPLEEPEPQERQPAVVREAPLVLRVIMDDPVVRPPRNDAPNAQPAAPAPGDGRRGRGGRGGPNNNHRALRGGARGGAVAGPRAGAGAARGRGRGAAAAGRGRARQNRHEEGRARQRQALQNREEERELAHAQLNPEQQAWIRRFVEMALEDVEDDMHDDSDDDDFGFLMR